MPIWNPFMAWIAAWALVGLSKLTKPMQQKKGSQAMECLNSISCDSPTHRSICSGWWPCRWRPWSWWRCRRARTSASAPRRQTPGGGGRWRGCSLRVPRWSTLQVQRDPSQIRVRATRSLPLLSPFPLASLSCSYSRGSAPFFPPSRVMIRHAIRNDMTPSN